MPITSDAVSVAALCIGAGTGAIIDMVSRRIPNAVSLATAVAGLVLAATGASGITLSSSLLGFAMGFVMMLPGHIFGATGAGDVKLFAAAGAVLGASRMVEAFVLVALTGGVFALCIACWRGRLVRTMFYTARMCRRPAAAKEAIESFTEHNSFAYGPAIAVGCVLAVLI